MNGSNARDRLLLPVLIPLGALAVIAGVVFGFSRVLLSVRPAAATGVALVVAFGALVSAAWIAGRKQVGTAGLAALLTAVAGIAMLAGGLAISAIGPEEEEHEVEAIALDVSAPPGASSKGFAETELAVPAGAPIELSFDNQEQSVQHNVSVWEVEDFSGTPLFSGELVTGPSTVEYSIQGLTAGTYYFRCDVHPTTMTGTIVAGEGGTETGGTETGTETGGEADVSIAARELVFDKAQFTLPAGEPATIAFTNDDPFDHNVAIYTDESLTTVLLQGELFTGPGTIEYAVPALEPGSYYFRCDLHPTMQGVVTVE